MPSSDHSQNSDNQRKHSRFASYNGIRAVSAGKELQTQKALVNISEGGLLFYAKEQVAKGTKIEVQLDIEEFNSSITLGAEVSWSQRSMEREDDYFVGVNFIDIADYDVDLIRKLQEKTRVN